MIGRVLLFGLLLLGGNACSPFRHAPHQEAAGSPLQQIAGVPYHAQEAREDCGPAALASLLNHRGGKVTVAEITRAVYSGKLGGTLLPDLENYARAKGYSTRSGRGDLQLLRRNVAAGRPVIALIETGFWEVSRPHYIVVFGYDDRRFLVHAGTREGVFIDAPELLKRWEKMSRLYLYLE